MPTHTLSARACHAYALPCRRLAGWFSAGALLGGFGPDAQGGRTGAAAAAAAKTWALGVPLGIALRSVARGYVPATSFMVVAMAATGVLMVGWRSALAAATPEVHVLASVHARDCARSVGWLPLVRMHWPTAAAVLAARARRRSS